MSGQTRKNYRASKHSCKTLKSKSQKGGEIDGDSQFSYDSIKLGKNIKMDNLNLPPSPPTDCTIL